MKRALPFLIMILIYGLGSLWLGEYAGSKLGYKKGYKAGQLDTLPTQSEVQEILGVPVDGWIGKESRRVWNELIKKRVCDEYAEPIMEQFNEDFNKLYGLGEN